MPTDSTQAPLPPDVGVTEADEDDEFGLLHEHAAELGLPFTGRPTAAREFSDLADGGRVSYLRWGDGEPELVFLHGGAQNAHTWDSVVLALGRPAVALDLPGHGRSSWRADRDYGPWRSAESLAAVLAKAAPAAMAVIGMSLGGATAIRLAATHPQLCRRLIIVDVTPGVSAATRTMTTAQRGAVALASGPPTFASFEEMVNGAIALSPLRPPAAVRRGVRHNAHRLPDGRWSWRYDLFGPRTEGAASLSDLSPLWSDVEAITAPTLLVRGGESHFVRDEDVAELRRRLPAVAVEVVPGAGHAVQSDQPLALASLIRTFTFPS